MTATGVGDPAVGKTLALLQSILERAVEWRRLDSNPARAARKPTQRLTRVVRPFPPDVIEVMRAHLLHRGQQLDATMIAVLAYAGLRPGARPALARRPRARAARRALRRLRAAQGDQDGPDPHRPSPSSPTPSPRGGRPAI